MLFSCFCGSKLGLELLKESLSVILYHQLVTLAALPVSFLYYMLFGLHTCIPGAALIMASSLAVGCAFSES